MNERNRRAAAALAALAALALAGCSATHVGEDWQCPLAQGEVCASVAAADPALPRTQGPEARAPETLVPAEGLDDDAPPYRPSPETGAAAEDGACASACGPLAWLAGLFAGISGDDGIGQPESGPASGVAAETRTPGASGAAATVAAAADPGTGATPPLSDEADAAATDADASTGDAVRTGETVARIWIAPFVDAGGIYREGAWVRAVIAPAGWRLP